MKASRFFIYMCLCLPALMVSCSDKDEPAPEVTPPAVVKKVEVDFLSQAPVFQHKAEQKEIEFKATGAWTAQVDQPWCSVSPTSGGGGTHTLKVSVDGNESPFERNASVALTTKDMEKRMTISQKFCDALLLTSARAEVSGKAQSVKVEVKANVGYDCKIDEKAQGWIKESRSRGLSTMVHQFEVADNESPVARQGKIFFEAGALKETFTVYQQPGEEAKLILSEKEVVVGYEQSTVKIELQSNAEFTMVVPEVGWIHEEKSRAMSSFTKYLTVSENDGLDDRMADVLFVYGEKVEKVTIYQKPKEAIILAKKQYEMPVEKGDLYLTVASNVAYETSCDVDWMKLVPASRGLSVKELHFALEANPGDKERTGVICFKSANSEQKVTVIQSGKLADGLVIFSEPKTFGMEGGSQDILISAGMNWKVSSMESWCKVSPAEGGEGHQKVTVTVDANTTYDERNAGIVFTYGDGLKKFVTVVQKQKDALLIDASKVEVSAKGGDVSFELKTNMQCSVTVDEDGIDWVTPVSSRALRAETYVFKVAENTGYLKRETSIRVKGNGLIETYRIYQEGRDKPTFILSKKEYYFDADQGKFTVELKTNKEYKVVMPTNSWVHQDESRAVSTYTHHFTVDKNNTGRERTVHINFVTEGVTEGVKVVQSGNTVSTKCRIFFNTVDKTVRIPLLQGSKEVTGIIKWDWNNEKPYAPNLEHVYSFDGSKQITIDAVNVESIYIDDLSGMSAIFIQEMN